MTNQKQTKDSPPLKTFSSGVLKFLTAIGLIIAIVLGINELIDRRIENEQFIRKVAANIRPYVIFDEDESILVDGGAMQDLEEIEVEKQTIQGRKRPKLKITITPKHHLVYKPLITPVIPIMYKTTSRRGSGHKFIYELTPSWTTVEPNEEITQSFVLEIFK